LVVGIHGACCTAPFAAAAAPTKTRGSRLHGTVRGFRRSYQNPDQEGSL